MFEFLRKSLTCALTLGEVVKAQIVRFLKFMRLVGDDGAWDWTTAALIASLFVLVFKIESPGIAELGAFFLALMARAHKKYLGAKSQGDVAAQIEVYKAESDKVIKSAHGKADEAFKALNDIRTRMGFDSMSWPQK